MTRACTAIALAALLAACAAAPGACQPASVSRLYLGRDSPRGDVADAPWEAFVADTVAMQFPQGFTVFDARGQWRADDGRIEREPSRVVEIVHDDSAQARARVDAIAAAYRQRFAQEAVLVTHSATQSCLLRAAN